MVIKQQKLDWIAHQFWLNHKKALGKQALQDALAVIQGKAFFEGKCYPVYTRIGMDDDKIYINLANKNWQAIEVTASDFQVLEKSPIKFRGLLTLLSKVITGVHNVHLIKKPRMADFAVLGVALENVMQWEEGSFMSEYQTNRKQNIVIALEHSPVATSIIKFMEQQGEFIGSYNKLYNLLASQFKSSFSNWPKSVKGFSIELKRQTPALKIIGINIEFDSQRHNDGFHVRISYLSDVHNVT